MAQFNVTWPDGRVEPYAIDGTKEDLIATHWGSTPVPKDVKIEEVGVAKPTKKAKE